MLKAFIATLGWSRTAYVEFCDDEKVETLIRAHENALLTFGGVPKEVLYDNMRTVVLERNAYGRGCIASMPASLTTPVTPASCRGCVSRIGRRRRVRWSGLKLSAPFHHVDHPPHKGSNDEGPN
ncbi:transposase [Hyphomicrobium sulfonivorans]|nr:transposase [Hyphomicrobium sulfonivorans]